jgi:GNAT superfamily N-acetyltransferase
MSTVSEIEFKPLTAERWGDLVQLFEGHGNPGYCWCTLWRLSSKEYGDLDSAGRKKAMEAIVGAGTPVGIIGYQHGEPVGWCSVAPRETYSRLERSPSFKRIDEKRTWSVVCFYLDRRLRGKGMAVEFLRAAVQYAVEAGAEMVEGYPVEPERDADGNWRPARSYRFMGYLSSYLKAGFKDVTPEGNRRKIVRYDINHEK